MPADALKRKKNNMNYSKIKKKLYELFQDKKKLLGVDHFTLMMRVRTMITVMMVMLGSG